MFTASASLKKNEVLILPLFKGEKPSVFHKKLLSKETLRDIEARQKAGDFEGEEGEQLLLFPIDKNIQRLVLLGRGDKAKQHLKSNELLGGYAAQAAEKAKAETVCIFVESTELRDIGCGFSLGNYRFKRYQKQDKSKKQVKEVNFILEDPKGMEALLKELEVYNNAFTLIRNLVNTAAGELRPKELAEEAKIVAKKYKLDYKLLDTKQIKKLGCGALYGVGQGAEEGPCMVILTYKHRTKRKKPAIAFVGKGITFDTGGLNIKPTNFIETMKQDMAGAATVLATMQAIAESKLPGYYMGVLSIAENAVSDHSIRPGDVLRAYNGKTIEVTNTDAEGRLILADALAYTEKNYQPETMIDIATLTGAVSVALGYSTVGVLGNDQEFVKEIMEAGKSMSERYWQLPLEEDFVKATKGDFTDLKNSTSGIRGETCMGAAFLKNFVAKCLWAHLDIGGTAWANSPTPTTRYGSTAVALRTFMEVARRRQG